MGQKKSKNQVQLQKSWSKSNQSPRLCHIEGRPHLNKYKDFKFQAPLNELLQHSSTITSIRSNSNTSLPEQPSISSILGFPRQDPSIRISSLQRQRYRDHVLTHSPLKDNEQETTIDSASNTISNARCSSVSETSDNLPSHSQNNSGARRNHYPHVCKTSAYDSLHSNLEQRKIKQNIPPGQDKHTGLHLHRRITQQCHCHLIQEHVRTTVFGTCGSCYETPENFAGHGDSARKKIIVNKEKTCLPVPPRREFDTNQLKNYDSYKVLEITSSRLQKLVESKTWYNSSSVSSDVGSHDRKASEHQPSVPKTARQPKFNSNQEFTAIGSEKNIDLRKQNLLSSKIKQRGKDIDAKSQVSSQDYQSEFSGSGGGERKPSKVPSKKPSNKTEGQELERKSTQKNDRKFSDMYGSEFNPEDVSSYEEDGAINEDEPDLDAGSVYDPYMEVVSEEAKPQSAEKLPEGGPTMKALEGGGICFQLPGRVTHKTTIKVAHFPRNEPPLMLTIPPFFPGGDPCALGNKGQNSQVPQNPNCNTNESDSRCMNNCNLYNFGANQPNCKFDPFKFLPRIHCG